MPWQVTILWSDWHSLSFSLGFRLTRPMGFKARMDSSSPALWIPRPRLVPILHFSLFTFHEIINIWKWKIYFKISRCRVRLEQNVSYNNVYLVPNGEMLFAEKFNKLWQIFADFPANVIASVYGTFSSNPTAQVKIFNKTMYLVE